jgi:group I intron endonuclease
MAKQQGYVVYKHTSPSGKSYIGLTNDYKRRCKDHQDIEKSYCRVFKTAIVKYGWDNFTHEILYENLTKEEAKILEGESILKFNSVVPNGYNLTLGGENCVHSEETVELLRITAKNRWKDEEYLNAWKEGVRKSKELKDPDRMLKRELVEFIKSEYQEKHDNMYPFGLYLLRPVPTICKNWKP